MSYKAELHPAGLAVGSGLNERGRSWIVVARHALLHRE